MADDPLRAAALAFQARDWTLARDLALEALAGAGASHDAFLFAGAASLRLGQAAMAAEYLQRAASMRSGNPVAQVELARAWCQLGEFNRAAAAADGVAPLALGNGEMAQALGAVYGQLGLHARALACFRAAVAAMPGAAEARFNLASELAFAGDFDAAEAELDACLVLDPRNWRAWLSRAQLRTQRPGSNHVDALRSALAAHAEPAAQLYLNMALAKELEDLGEDAEAFTRLVAGKAAGGRGRDYASANDAALFDAIAACFPAPLQADAAGGCADQAPIFVFGMPRSGTTLVDRILSSHPQVASIGESMQFPQVLQSQVAPGPAFVMAPGLPARLDAVDWQRAGRAYVDGVRRQGVAAPRFVDKLPHNFLFAGFIARALPKATLVCLHRNPMDTCLGNFRQLFAADSPYFGYSYDLLDTGRYYLMFRQLMAHWRQVLPGRIVDVSYEALVDDQGGETRRLLAACDLPWDERCLAFHANPAPTGTASAVQVRAPLHRGRVDRWKRFEPQLQPLRELLDAGGVAIGA